MAATTLQQIQRVHVVLVIGVALLAFASDLMSGWSVLFGGAVMGLNFWIMRKFFGYLLSPDAHRRAPTVVVLGVAKQLLFFGLVGLLFWRVDLDAVAFAVGVTILMIACLTVAISHPPLPA